jgi:hypothetical protein
VSRADGVRALDVVRVSTDDEHAIVATGPARGASARAVRNGRAIAGILGEGAVEKVVKQVCSA